MESPPKPPDSPALESLSIKELGELLVAHKNPAVAEEFWRRVEPKLRNAAAAEAFRKAPEELNRAHVVQEALDSVLLRLGKLAASAETSLEGLLTTTVRSRVADLCRGQRRWTGPLTTGEDAEKALAGAVDPSASPEQILIDRETTAQQAEDRKTLALILLLAMEMVTEENEKGPRQMTAVRLRFFEDLTVAEIAERIGMSKRAAEYALTDGFEALRMVLKEQFGIEGKGSLIPPNGEDDDE